MLLLKNFGYNENVFWFYDVSEPLSLNQTKPSAGSPQISILNFTYPLIMELCLGKKPEHTSHRPSHL